MQRLKQQIGICKIYWDSEYNEWSVAVVGQTDAATYFTDDKQDAIDTAKMMNRIFTRD